MDPQTSRKDILANAMFYLNVHWLSYSVLFLQVKELQCVMGTSILHVLMFVILDQNLNI